MRNQMQHQSHNSDALWTYRVSGVMVLVN